MPLRAGAAPLLPSLAPAPMRIIFGILPDAGTLLTQIYAIYAIYPIYVIYVNVRPPTHRAGARPKRDIASLWDRETLWDPARC